MQAKVSQTAASSAAQRALHTMYAPAPKIFEDPFAFQLAGRRWQRLIGLRPLAWLMQRWLFRWIRPVIGLHVARARYAEDCLDDALGRGLAQYVVLGAGMDTFGLRRPELADSLTVFEVDHPGTQAAKREIMNECRLAEPEHVRYVPVDFETDSLETELQGAGFQGDALTLFSWLGVQPFLTREAITQTLRTASRLATPGSELVCDVMNERALTDGTRDATTRRSVEFAARSGEPFVTGLAAAEFEEMLESTGWKLVELVDPEGQNARWFEGRTDGLEPWKYFYLVRARVADEPAG